MSTSTFARPRGFTLVELLVVLGILVVLSTVAVQSLSGVQDQAQYQATQRSLTNIEDAVLGPSNSSANGFSNASGFVADMGRLPFALPVTLPDGSTLRDASNKVVLQPGELWQNNTHLPALALVQASWDKDISVACGWRGPYLRLGIGQSSLSDGWGNPYVLLKADRTLAGSGDEAAIFRSNGSDNLVSSAATGDYRDDVYLNFNTLEFKAPAAFPVAFKADRYHVSALLATIKGVDTALGNVFVVYYGPDPETGGLLQYHNATGETPTVTLTSTVTNAVFTAGPRTLRAYQMTQDNSAVSKMSNIVRANLVAGVNPFDFDLTLTATANQAGFK